MQQIEASVTKVENAINEYLPGIICWGDSLTAGAGGNGIRYPLVLEELVNTDIISDFDIEELAERLGEKYVISLAKYTLSDIAVINMGVGGENTKTILGRNGAVPFTVGENFSIPADNEKVEIKISGGTPLRQGTAGMDWVEIGGIRGVISIQQESYTAQEYTYFFARNESGEEVEIKAGTEIVTAGSMQYRDYLPIVFMGTNGGYDNDPQTLIEQQMAIINHQTANQDRYIIVGIHTGTAEERAELEVAMESRYGNKYINLREYLTTDGIEDANELFDAGIEITERDAEMMEKGMAPASLMVSDELHFNSYGYQLIGNLIYTRMDELGYFDEVKEAISEVMDISNNTVLE